MYKEMIFIYITPSAYDDVRVNMIFPRHVLKHICGMENMNWSAYDLRHALYSTYFV